MPCSLTDAIAELDRLLEPQAFRDYCPNGLQVPGREEVSKVVTGVSASAELFERAIAAKADLIVVHHGLFWGSTPAAIDLPMKRRLKLLFDADVVASPPTTSRSTPTPRWATTRSSPARSAPRSCNPSPSTSHAPSASSRASPTRGSPPRSSSRA